MSEVNLLSNRPASLFLRIALVTHVRVARDRGATDPFPQANLASPVSSNVKLTTRLKNPSDAHDITSDCNCGVRFVRTVFAHLRVVLSTRSSHVRTE